MARTVYLGQLSGPNGKRKVSVAANTLMQYVIKTVAQGTENMLVLSYAQCGLLENAVKSEELSCGAHIIYFDEELKRAGNVIEKIKNRKKHEKALLKFVCEHLQDGDTLIAYHSLGLMKLLRKIKRRKKITLVMQVAEIYSDVDGTEKQRKNEIKFLKEADRYIFSSVPLCELINDSNKPYAICMGTYDSAPQVASCFDDGKCHIVYAGTFNPIKGGVFNAIDAAEHLDENYHLHLLGGGEEKLLKVVIKKMLQMSVKTSCEITYDGYLQGEEYLKFLQSCHIGLSTQNAQAAYSDTSFPSKVLVYFANGLRVVSSGALPLKKSSIKSEIFFYEGSDPSEIARAVKTAREEKAQDTRAILNELDKVFKAELFEMLSK